MQVGYGSAFAVALGVNGTLYVWGSLADIDNSTLTPVDLHIENIMAYDCAERCA